VRSSRHTDEAERLASECLAIGTDSGQPDADAIFAVQLLGVKANGNHGDLIPVIEQIGPTCRTWRRRRSTAHWLSRTWKSVGSKMPPRARQVRRRRLRVAARLGWLLSIATYADVAIACRDREMAGPLFDLLAPFAGQLSTNGGATVDGPVSHFLGGLCTVLGATTMQLRISRRPPCQREGRGHLLRCPDRPPLGQMLAERGAADDIEKARTLLERRAPLLRPRVRGHRVALDATLRDLG